MGRASGNFLTNAPRFRHGVNRWMFFWSSPAELLIGAARRMK